MLLLISVLELNPGPLNFGVLNARSVISKGPLIQDLISSNSFDLLAVTETWTINDDPDAVLLDVVPQGYRVLHESRTGSTAATRGGGLCFIYRNNLNVKPHPLQRKLRCTTFELQLLSVSDSRKNLDSGFVIANIYRPPWSSRTTFIDELSDLLTDCANYIRKNRFIACGDFNCPGDSAAGAAVGLDPVLVSALHIHGLTQHVAEPTRSTESVSNLLDLVISLDTTIEPSVSRGFGYQL
jgi:hypothetical protein